MKKSLLAMALVSAFAAPAFAGVQVYGVVDMGVQSVDDGATTDTVVKSGGQSGSRLGFKGGEDLGGGLKAEFVMEAGVNAATGATNEDNSTFFGRQTWLGLSSADMGSVRVGRQYSTLYTTAGSVDPMGLGLTGNAWDVLGGGAGAARLDNALTYVAPAMGGVQVQAQYGFAPAGSNDTSYSLGASYTQGPLMVTGSYGKAKEAGSADKTETLIGGTYDMGTAKLHAGWSESKQAAKDVSYLVGVSAPVAAGTVMASWTRNKVDGVADTTTDAYSVAYSYSLSKQTNVYTSYTRLSNGAAASLGGDSVVPGNDVSKFGVGVRHSF